MRIDRRFDLDALARQLSGKEVLPDVDPWASRIRALSKAITFLENEPRLATELLQNPALVGCRSTARVIGLTGLPGAGKSSLTNLIVRQLRAEGKTVAVLAVDPSSARTGGAILGDRVRMHEHFRDPQVFIRSMGSRGALGGLARAARGVIRVMGIVGFDTIVVETVGVGQSESEIVDIADTTALVLMPNSGDDIQLMKAGVLEVADVFVINKADLSNPARMVLEIVQNLMTVNRADGWKPPVIATSALENRGVDELVGAFFDHGEFERTHPRGRETRRQRVQNEVVANAFAILEERLRQGVASIPVEDLDQVDEGFVPAMVIAGQLVDRVLQKG